MTKILSKWIMYSDSVLWNKFGVKGFRYNGSEWKEYINQGVKEK